MSMANHHLRVGVALLVFGSVLSSARAELTHRFSFSDGAKDSVGKVEGKLMNGATVAEGKLVLKNENVSSSDAKVQYLDFGSPILPKSGSVTIAIWFTASDAGDFARLLNVGDKEGSEGLAFIYITPRTGEGQARAAISATDTGSRIPLDNPSLADGKPHLMVVTIDGAANKMHMFVDGIEPTAAVDLGENTLAKVKQNNNWVGRSSFDNDAGLTGSIDEIRVFDTALSLEEVTAMTKAGPDALPGAATKPAAK